MSIGAKFYITLLQPEKLKSLARRAAESLTHKVLLLQTVNLENELA